MIDLAHPGIINSYGLHGDNPPPTQKLEGWINKLRTSAKPSTMLVAADMWIDLAMQVPDEASASLDNARRVLNDVVEDHAYLTSNGFGQLDSSFGNVASAATKLADIPRIEQTLTQETTSVTFDEDLTALEVLFRNGIIPSSKVNAAVAEYLPVLLSHRAQERIAGENMTGRLGLHREDKRPVLRRGYNPNWDVALFNSDSPQDISSPSIRLQVKTANGNKSESHLNAGVIPIIVKGLGIKSPISVIASCMKERADGPNSDGLDTYSPDEMDDFYRLMLEKVQAAQKDMVDRP